MPEKPASNKFQTLTSMRGIAALMVAIFHLRYWSPGLPSFLDPEIFSKGYLWVDFFFILSGFVLAYRYQEAKALFSRKFIRSFLTARLARIYPVHFLTLWLCVLYFAVKDGPSVISENVTSIFANLFLVHGWGHLFFKSWNFPSWTISTEWGAYLLFPLLLWTSRRLGKVKAFRISLILSLMGILWFLARHFNGCLNLTEKYGLLRCLPEFSTGILLYQLKGEGSQVKVMRFHDALAFLLFLLAIYLQVESFRDFFSVPVFSLLILTLSGADGFFSNVLKTRLFIWLGEISYSIYMFQVLIGYSMKGLIWSDFFLNLGIPPYWVMELGFAAKLLLLLLISSLSYIFFETRCRKIIRSF